MPINIAMPSLSPTMEEGNIAKWLVNEGDRVTSGDVIAEIETDKATIEIEAPGDGTVAKLLHPAGTQGIKVNSMIAVLTTAGEAVSDIAQSDAVASSKPKDEQSVQSAQSVKSQVPTTPHAQNDTARLFVSPLARRLANQAGLDLASVAGSGPHGRVIKIDVEKRIADARPEQAPAVAVQPPLVPAGMSDDAVLKMFDEGSYELIPHDSMRKTIASRLLESYQTVPSYHISIDCELDALQSLRAELNKRSPMIKVENEEVPAYRLSVNDFILKALALALRDVPMANASWTSTARVKHQHSDIGVAVAIPDGLIVPIIKKAELKTISAISNETKELVRRAREKKLKPEEYQGGTAAVSNLGMFGVSSFTSIINPPHGSIVSIGAGIQTPVVKGGEVKIATVMNATFAFDHRVIDGALGAELAAAFQRNIQNPMAMLV